MYDLNVLSYFKDLPDPRQAGKVLYPLDEILLTALCAIVAGADAWTEVADFGRLKLPFLRRFLPFAHGIPSHDTFTDVFRALDPQAFEACFLAWVARLQQKLRGVVAIDGKSVRRSRDGGQEPLHLVGAWAAGQRLVLGQRRVDPGRNEITAIPALLELLVLTGAIVTVDAMGCQKEIARTIRDRGGDYVLALKKNQGGLHEDVETFLTEQRACDFRDCVIDRHDETDAGHGRIEVRRCWASSDIAWLRERHPDWKALTTIAQVEATRILPDKTTTKTRYYISSLPAQAPLLAAAVRDHWDIENGLHWVLDMGWREDECRIRKGAGAQNFALLRRVALNLLQRAPTRRIGLRPRRKMAGWDNRVLEQTLRGP